MEDEGCDAESAIVIGNMMIKHGLFQHVTKEHGLKNKGLFYRWCDGAGDGTASAAVRPAATIEARG